MKRERRVKAFWVDENDLVIWFNFWRSPPDACAFPVFGGLPEDAWVEGVHYSPGRRGLMVHVASESFDVVPDGDLPPMEVPEGMRLVRLRDWAEKQRE